MVNSEKLQELRAQAEEAKALYNIGKMTRAEAKAIIEPFIKMANERAVEIAKKYNMKPKKISFIAYVR